MKQKFEKINGVNGRLKLPGDKSISHRAVIFSSLAKGQSEITNLLESEDVFSTINCFRSLGCKIEKRGERYFIEGAGHGGLKAPTEKLDAGNSGTTARLISGILAVQRFPSVLIGDESLSKRPMRRVTNPLKLMGSEINLTDGEHLPAEFHPSRNLKNIQYELEVASAQVKSALLLAAIQLNEPSIIIEKSITRDHTERMLGCEIEFRDGKKFITASLNDYPIAKEYTVPSDISTAAFFIVLTLLSKKSELLLENVSLNPTRTGLLDVLREMDGNIIIENQHEEAGELIGNIIVKSSSLKNVHIPADIIPNIVDEIPILSVAGLLADGKFKIQNAAELRVKESDRIEALCSNYRKLGVQVIEFDDGFELAGRIKNSKIEFDSFGDHRIAMTFAVLSSLILDESLVNNFECVSISNPEFLQQLNSIKK